MLYTCGCLEEQSGSSQTMKAAIGVRGEAQHSCVPHTTHGNAATPVFFPIHHNRRYNGAFTPNVSDASSSRVCTLNADALHFCSTFSISCIWFTFKVYLEARQGHIRCVKIALVVVFHCRPICLMRWTRLMRQNAPNCVALDVQNVPPRALDAPPHRL